MKLLKIVLPWPNDILNPNARPNRFTKAAAIKRARKDAGFGAFAAIRAQRWPTGIARASLQPVFYSPDNDRVRRDGDNFAAALKAYQDGITDAGTIKNDRGFRNLPPRFETDSDKRVEFIVTEELEIDFEAEGCEKFATPFRTEGRAIVAAEAIGYRWQGNAPEAIVRLADGTLEVWAMDGLVGDSYKCGDCSRAFVFPEHKTACPNCGSETIENVASSPTMGPNAGKVFNFTDQCWNDAPPDVPFGSVLDSLQKLLANPGRRDKALLEIIGEIQTMNRGTEEEAAGRDISPAQILAMLRALPVSLAIISGLGSAK